MDDLLIHFDRVTDPKRIATHCSLSPPGKYYLNASEEKKFINEYVKIVEKNQVLEEQNKELIPLHIAEINPFNIPFFLDIDIKTPSSRYKKTIPNLYSDDDLKTFTATVNQILLDKVDIKDQENELRGVILEKKPYIKDDFIKHGIHIHYPNLILDKDDISKVLIPEIQKKINQINIFLGIEKKNVIIDDVAKKPWLMYGSFKPGCKPYYVTKSFDSTGQPCFIHEAFHKNFNTTKETIKQDLPRLLSILWTNSLIKNDKKKLDLINLKEIYTEVKFNIENIVQENDIQTPISYENYDPDIVSDGKLKYFKIKKLLFMLNKERADTYEKWWEIGIILFNEGNGSEIYLELWKEFSKQSNTYNEHGCEYYWNQMEKKQNSLIKKKCFGTLMYLCKKDNPNFQRDYLEVEINPFDDDKVLYIPPTETKIAKMVYRILDGKYLYDVQENKWYAYNNPIWEPCKKISTLLIPEFEKIVTLFKLRINKSLQKLKIRLIRYNKEKKKNAAKIELVKKIQKTYEKGLKFLQNKLENMSGIKNIISMLESFCGNQNTEFNIYPHLIAFSNGVFDCNKKEFREGYPTDMLSKKTMTKYDKELSMESSSVQNVLKFFEKIFPNKEVREYFLQTNTDFLFGKNRRKIIMWVGEGSNGKSLTQKIYEKMLRGLSSIIPKKGVCVSQSDNSSSATPEIARLDGVRWVAVTDEVKKAEDVLSASKICKLTGADTIYARKLYDDGKDIEPAFQLTLLCNTLPNILGADNATWDRIKIIPFESTFVDDPKQFENEKNIFQKDPFFDFNPLLEPLLWLSVYYFKNPMTHVLSNLPTPVVEEVNKYKENNCVVKQYIKDTFVKTDSAQDIVRPTEHYEHFKQWFSEGHPIHNKNNIVKTQFIKLFFENFENKLNCKKNYITNLKINRDYEDEGYINT